MSLKVAAQHLSAKGRGPDDTLVHMSRGEVKSLNDLAMAHGGQLTINPQTGLPEAGFLSAILPMVAGAALTGLSGGAINPLTAGMIVGAGSYALNPKAGLMGGLMAGMGAYGGAGLGEALASQGMEQAASAKLAENEAYKNALAEQQIKSETIGKAFQSGSITADQFGKQAMEAAAPAQNLYSSAMGSVTPDTIMGRADMLGQGVKSLGTEGGFSNLYNRMGGGMGTAKTALTAAAPFAALQKDTPVAPVVDKDMGQRYSYNSGMAQPLPAPDMPSYDVIQQGNFGKEQNYYPNQRYTPISNETAKNIYGFADGGMPVEQMSNNAMMGVNTMYPMAGISTSSYGTPNQMASGGISDAGYNLGGYSDGGRLLRGPGDGVSDSIPAVIGKKQPARLADGEFVVPARIVSEIGNGSTEAGARKLYGMMDRVQAARGKTVGKGKVAHNTRADKYLPA